MTCEQGRTKKMAIVSITKKRITQNQAVGCACKSKRTHNDTFTQRHG